MPKKYYVYKLDFLGMYYFGFTSSLQSRIKTHISIISNSLINKECKSTIPFHHTIFDYCTQNGIGYRYFKKHFNSFVLKKFNSKIWAIRYEEYFIENNIKDSNCKNILQFNSCKSKGRKCISSDIIIENEIIKPNFCINCSHSIK